MDEDDAAGMLAERRDGSLGLWLVKIVAKQMRGRAVMVAGLIRPARGIDQGISLRSGASACGC
jgi:hypothetical protein